MPTIISKGYAYLASLFKKSFVYLRLLGSLRLGLIIIGFITGWILLAALFYPDQTSKASPLHNGSILNQLGGLLGLNHPFSSWWFLICVLLLVVNLGFCTLKRLNRVLHFPGWHGWGSFFLHCGLILVVIGGMLSSVGKSEQIFAALPGQFIRFTSQGHSVAMLVNSFNIDFAGLEPQQYYTSVTIEEKGVPNKKQVIAVNHPLSLEGTKTYQSSYGWAISGDLLSEKGKQQVLICSGDLQKIRDNPILLMKAEFFPDYLLEDNESTTASELPRRPRALIHVYSSTKLLKTVNLAPGQTMNIAGYSFRFNGFKRYTILRTKSDPGLPWVWSGFTLLTGGLFIRYLIPSKELRRKILER